MSSAADGASYLTYAVTAGLVIRVLWTYRFAIVPIVQVVFYVFQNPCSHGITWARFKRVAFESENGGRINLGSVTIQREPSVRRIGLIPTVENSTDPSPRTSIILPQPHVEIEILQMSTSPTAPTTSGPTSVTTSPQTESAAIAEALNQIITIWSNKKLTINVFFTQAVQSVQVIERVLTEGGVKYNVSQLKQIISSVLQQLLTTHLSTLDPYISVEGVALLQEMIPIVCAESLTLEQDVQAGCFGKRKTTKAQVSAGGLVIQRPALSAAASSSVPATPMTLLSPTASTVPTLVVPGTLRLN